MSDATTTTPEKPAKPAVLDGRDEGKQESITLNVRVKMLADKDKDGEGKPLVGTVTGIEYQRQRVVVKLDSQEKLVVRPASKVWVLKNKSGKIEFDTERMAKAVRGAKAKAAVEVEATNAEAAEAAVSDAAEDAPAPV